MNVTLGYKCLYVVNYRTGTTIGPETTQLSGTPAFRNYLHSPRVQCVLCCSVFRFLCKSKDRKYNGEKEKYKKDKRWSTNNTQI